MKILLLFLLFCYYYFVKISCVVRLKAKDASKSDQFGFTTSIYKNKLVVSAIGDDDYGSYTGSAYVFQRINGGWSLQNKLIPFEGNTDGQFSSALQLHEDTLVIGAHGDHTADYFAGAVYIYNEVSSAWTMTAKLIAYDAIYNNEFGTSLHFYDNVMVIGADGVDYTPQIENAGAAYIYSRDPNSNSWSFQYKLISNESVAIGKWVDIYETTIFVSKTGDFDYAGAVIVYNGDLLTGWTQTAVLVASDRRQDDFFGWSFSVYKNTLAIGAYHDDDFGQDTGSVYIFNSVGIEWSQQSKLIAENPTIQDEYGYTVSLYGDNLIVGNPQDDDLGAYSGSAFVYHKENNQWTQSTKIIPEGGLPNSYYGYSVNLHDLELVVSAYKSDDGGGDTGSVYVYNITSLPTPSPTFMPSTSPTFRPSSLPSSSPTYKPTAIPTSRPTFSPTISNIPTNVFLSAMRFSVTQVLVDVDYQLYMNDYEASNDKFAQSISKVVNGLEFQHIRVDRVIETSSSSLSTLSTSKLINSKNSHNLKLKALSQVTLVYNISLLLTEGIDTANSIYSTLTQDISIASTGQSSTLITELKTTGPPFSSSSVTDLPPDFTTYKTYTEHSAYPSSIPTSVPSCSAGVEETINGCIKCEPGTYSSFAGEECQKCDIGYYCDSYGCDHCTKCSYPWTTLNTGETECKAVQLHFPNLIIYTILITLVALFLLFILIISKSRFACLIIMTLPFLDLVTDILYLTLSPFYGIKSFIASAILLIIIPILIFSGILIQYKAYPRVFGKEFLPYLLFLNISETNYPTYRGKEIFKSFLVHDSIIKFIYFISCWLISIILQSITLIPVFFLFLLQLPFWIVWLIIGTLLYQTKIISIGKIWNFWFEIWTNSSEFNSYTELNIQIFNKSLLTEFLFESLPQLCIQAYNNTQLHRWSVLAYISTVFSLYMTLDGLWRITYYKLYSGYSFDEIPIGMCLIRIISDDKLLHLIQSYNAKNGIGNGNNQNNGNNNSSNNNNDGDISIEAAEIINPTAPVLYAYETSSDKVQAIAERVISVDSFPTF